MPRNRVRATLTLTAALLLLSSGCNGKSVVLNEQVEGTVKLDDKPLPNVMVQFVPDIDAKVQAPQSSAITDEKGHYTLACDNKKSGAVVGKHNVVVLAGRAGADNRLDQADAPAAPRAYLPPFYALTAKTPLQVEVTRDQHTYDLNLSVNAKPR